MIATPTPGTVKTGYMKSVIATIRDLARRGIESEFDTWEGSDIASQRNMLASRFLRADGFTHLFFVDSDMDKDRRYDNVRTITLSYTFYEAKTERAKTLLGGAPANGSGKGG